jgi:colanic acid/amylovoran biosynthesis glycosyltransferase
LPQSTPSPVAMTTVVLMDREWKAPVKIGYVLNTYPAPSQSFIRREIQALERRGLTIERFAMRAHEGTLVDKGDRAEAARTDHVLGHGGWTLAKALGRMALTRPGKLVGALGLAIRAGRGSQAGVLRHLVYLVEAAYIADRAQVLELDRLHAHFGTNAATVAMLAHALGAPPFSFTVHGPEEFDRPEALALPLKLEQADFAVAISSFGRGQLLRWAPLRDWRRVHVVHCGIEPAKFSTPAPLPVGRPLRLVNVGRFHEQKGQLLLIRAIAELARREVPVHLTLVGDGPLRGAIERAISHEGLGMQVSLTGWLDEAGVRDALEGSHGLVLSSFAEGLPMVVMEAMAAGRPVISTQIAGVPELMRHGKTGWLVPAGDVEALVEAITDMAMTGTDKLSAMGRSARARALTRHDIDAEAEKLADLFAQRPRAQRC